MRNFFRSTAVIVASIFTLLSLAAGCGGGGSSDRQGAKQASAPAKAPVEKSAPAKPAAEQKPAVAPVAAALAGKSGAGSITGLITFSGERPKPAVLDINKDVSVCGKTEKIEEAFLVGEGGELGNAVVYLVGVANAPPAPKPAQNPLIDQKECRYEPHVSLVPAGATIDIRNSDGILHNLHTYSTANPPFNAAQPKFKKVITKQLDAAEFVKLTCDVHGWMQAWIVVHDHPYYALTDASGRFSIDDVPPGEYEIAVWHEQLGDQSGRVTVEAGVPATFNSSMTAS